MQGYQRREVGSMVATRFLWKKGAVWFKPGKSVSWEPLVNLGTLGTWTVGTWGRALTVLAVPAGSMAGPRRANSSLDQHPLVRSPVLVGPSLVLANCSLQYCALPADGILDR